MNPVVKSILLFVLAGLCEIGGGYLVWQWWRNGGLWVIIPAYSHGSGSGGSPLR
jgi:drug/metabolite transporter superfamily protein YnfA